MNDSLHSFVMAIIFAYQQGIIAGSTISSPPPSITINTSSTSSTQSSSLSTSAVDVIPPSIPTTIPPSSTTNITVSPSIRPFSSPQNQRYSVRRIPTTSPSITNNYKRPVVDGITPPHPPRSHHASKQSSSITSPPDYSIIINQLPIGLSGFPLIKPSCSSSLLSSIPFRALPPFTIRKERRGSKRNGWRSSKRSTNRQSSAKKSKSNNRKRGNNNNNINNDNITSSNRFSILASMQDITSPIPDNHHQQAITISSPHDRTSIRTRSSTPLIIDDPTFSSSRPSDLAYPSADVDIADSSESIDDRLIEAEIEEIVKPMIDRVCMHAVMNARFIDITGADSYEWAECDAFINHPSRLPPPSHATIPSPSISSPLSSTITLTCHICSSEIFSCCPDCSAPLCYPHFNPADDQFASTNSTLSAHTCAAFLQSVADEADRCQKEKNDNNTDNAVQKSQSAAKNKKKKAKKKTKSITNPPPSSPPPSTATTPSPFPPPPPSTTITRRILEDLIDKFNDCHDKLKPKTMKKQLERTIDKLYKVVDHHYDNLLFDDDNEIDDEQYDQLADNHDIPITLSSDLVKALHSLRSHLAPFYPSPSPSTLHK